MHLVWWNEFFSLRDKIRESKTVTPNSFISASNIRDFSERFGSITHAIERISSLPKLLQRTLDVIDFDDTLSSRDKSFFRVPELIDRRWEAWNAFIQEKFGFWNFVQEVYDTKDTVWELVNVLLSQNPLTPSLLLSAWIQKLQWFKFEQTQVTKSEKKVVKSQSMKPEELLEYIISTLWYIPWKIIIYEDRPECFHKTAELLVQVLWIEIVVNHVHLSNERFNTVDFIDQTIYKL